MAPMHDDVFKALADETRREILDRLHARAGQTLSELCDGLAMTRFGVMKHLRVLEGAGLVVAVKRGREKHHYLNSVPIRGIYERWVTKFSEPRTEALLALQRELEAEHTEERARVRPTTAGAGNTRGKERR